MIRFTVDNRTYRPVHVLKWSTTGMRLLTIIVAGGTVLGIEIRNHLRRQVMSKELRLSIRA